MITMDSSQYSSGSNMYSRGRSFSEDFSVTFALARSLPHLASSPGACRPPEDLCVSLGPNNGIRRFSLSAAESYISRDDNRLVKDESPSTASGDEASGNEFMSRLQGRPFADRNEAVEYARTQARKSGFNILVRTSRQNYAVLVCGCRTRGNGGNPYPMNESSSPNNSLSESRRGSVDASASELGRKGSGSRRVKRPDTGCRFHVILFREDSQQPWQFRSSKMMEHNHTLPIVTVPSVQTSSLLSPAVTEGISPLGIFSPTGSIESSALSPMTQSSNLNSAAIEIPSQLPMFQQPSLEASTLNSFEFFNPVSIGAPLIPSFDTTTPPAWMETTFCMQGSSWNLSTTSLGSELSVNTDEGATLKALDAQFTLVSHPIPDETSVLTNPTLTDSSATESGSPQRQAFDPFINPYSDSPVVHSRQTSGATLAFDEDPAVFLGAGMDEMEPLTFASYGLQLEDEQYQSTLPFEMDLGGGGSGGVGVQDDVYAVGIPELFPGMIVRLSHPQ